MALERCVDKEAGVVTLVGRGPVTADDFVAETRSQLEEPPLPGAFHVLFDLREAHFEGDIEPLKRLAREMARMEFPFRQRVAQLVGTDLEFGLARLFDALAEGGPSEYRIFRDAAEARRWVGLPEDE